jgi:hypothetical protein
MSFYAIGIGGTGAKCLEALTQTAAVGLLNGAGNNSAVQTIQTLFVDADETNGSLERARASITQYQECRELFGQSSQMLPWMQAQVKSLGLWSPLSKVVSDKKLGALFGYDSLKQTSPELASLVDVLFTHEEMEANLEVGFRGRPAIGSAVMSQIDLDNLDEDVWRHLIERVRIDAGNGRFPKIFLFGSIFGGTGASGIPTIGRLLHEKLIAERLRDRVSIGAAFMLPYFSFTPEAGLPKDEVYARSDQFLLNTEAALRYYLKQSQPFNTVYVLGDHNTTEVEFSLGKTGQRNRPHFVELYAALVARHFSMSNSANEGTQVALISRQHQSQITWRDLPDSDEARSRLGTATRFAYVWLANIVPELNDAKEIGIKRFQSGAPWFSKFFKPSTGTFGRMFDTGGEELADFNDPKEQKALLAITTWCLDYLRWLGDIHQCGDENINLFRQNCLAKAKGIAVIPDELSDLLIGTEADRTKRTSDSIQELKKRLDDPDSSIKYGQGAVGLSKALYTLCEM